MLSCFNSIWRRSLAASSALAICLMLTSCSIKPPIGGDKLRSKALPTATIPNQFAGQSKQNGIPASFVKVDDAWLKQFQDQELNQLVAEALRNSPDMQVIASRRLQAESLIKAASGAQFPGINAIGNTGGQVGSSGTGLTGYYIGAGWELDLWGRVRTSIAGAKQNARAIYADQDAARLSLIATLTKTTWLARTLQEQARLTNESAAAAQIVSDLTAIREKIGASSQADLSTSKLAASQAKELALSTALARDQTLRAVEVLVGRYPDAKPLNTSLIPQLPSPVAPGLPADLLERRPDIIAAEARVNSAFYATEEKRLARLPKISLTAGFGSINSQVFALTRGPSTSLGTGANVFIPLFQGGAIEAQIAYQNAEAQAAIANYGKVALSAFNDVENALNGEATWRERSSLLQNQLNEQRRLLDNRHTEFRIGRIDQRQVQQEIIRTNAIEMNWRQGQVDALAQRVNLYLALGGSPTE
jgi:NodT family efflux transporter outer membrane factor (OMF) lipoprotein